MIMNAKSNKKEDRRAVFTEPLSMRQIPTEIITISTRKYLIGILSRHFPHFPFKNRKLKRGISAGKVRTSLEQKHRDLSQSNLPPGPAAVIRLLAKLANEITPMIKSASLNLLSREFLV